MKLTISAIRNIPVPAKGTAEVFDSLAPNLSIRVMRSGARVFYVRRTQGGSRKRFKLGTFPNMTPRQARAQAHALPN